MSKTKIVELTEEERIRLATIIKVNILPELDELWARSMSAYKSRENKHDFDLFTKILKKLDN